MSSTGSNPMDAVSTLMQERQRVEAWLAALESKRAITPPHVYDRVRADYEKRLREVMSSLGGRTNELREMIAALTARMAKLQTDENAKRDERYEAELRATVGELEAGKWETQRRAIDDTIARITAERTNVSTELARVQQILSMTGAGSGGAPLVAPAAEGQAAGANNSGQQKRFDELAFLSSVVESPPGGAAPPPPPAAPRTGSYTAQQSGPVATQAPPGTAKPPAGGTPAGPSAVRPGSGSQPPAPPTTGSQPAAAETPEYLKDVPTEATRTLKCNECGTMNFATEWYCERCGGELAAM